MFRLLSIFFVSFHSLVSEQVKRYFYRCLNKPLYRNILFFVEILVFCFDSFFSFFLDREIRFFKSLKNIEKKASKGNRSP